MQRHPATIDRDAEFLERLVEGREALGVGIAAIQRYEHRFLHQAVELLQKFDSGPAPR